MLHGAAIGSISALDRRRCFERLSDPAQLHLNYVIWSLAERQLTQTVVAVPRRLAPDIEHNGMLILRFVKFGCASEVGRTRRAYPFCNGHWSLMTLPVGD